MHLAATGVCVYAPRLLYSSTSIRTLTVTSFCGRAAAAAAHLHRAALCGFRQPYAQEVIYDSASRLWAAVMYDCAAQMLAQQPSQQREPSGRGATTPVGPWGMRLHCGSSSHDEWSLAPPLCRCGLLWASL